MTASFAHPRSLIPRLGEAVETFRTGESLIRLRGPLLRRPLLLRWIAWLLGQPKLVEVELDDIGTWVIERCDGRTLDQLAGELASHLRLSRREAETALADFTRLLLTRRLLTLENVRGVERAA